MLFRAVCSKALLGNLKLSGRKAKSHKRQDPQLSRASAYQPNSPQKLNLTAAYQNTDSILRQLFQTTDIDSLRIISKPISLHSQLAQETIPSRSTNAYKVNPFDIQPVKFFIPSLTHKQLQERFLDISMTPIFPSNLRNADNIPGPESHGWCSEQQHRPR